MIHVEHGGLGPLQQDRPVFVQRPVQDQGGVGEVGPDPLPVPQVCLGDGGRVDAAAVVDLGKHLVLLAQHQVQLLRQDAWVEQVLHPDPGAGDLVAVGGADAAPGGADPRIAEVAFGHLVQRPVVGHDQVRVGGDQQPVTGHAALGEAIDLGDQYFRVDHHAITDDGCDLRGQHA